MSLKDEFQDKKEHIGKEIDEAKENIKEKVAEGVKKTKSFLKKLIIAALLLFVVGAGFYIFWSNWTYSEGSRTGYLIKISEKGYVFKTFEGQLNLGGFKDSDQGTISGNTWDFSLKDENLYKQLEALEGKKVMLRYKEINRAMPWQGETNYFIYEIEERD